MRREPDLVELLQTVALIAVTGIMIWMTVSGWF